MCFPKGLKHLLKGCVHVGVCFSLCVVLAVSEGTPLFSVLIVNILVWAFLHLARQLKCLSAVTLTKSAVITLTSGCLLTSPFTCSHSALSPSHNHCCPAGLSKGYKTKLALDLLLKRLRRGRGDATGNCGTNIKLQQQGLQKCLSWNQLGLP